jgi:hypothetical protein
LPSRKLNISDSIFNRCADEVLSSSRERRIAVPQIPLVAKMIVVRITHDGIERAPLINGTTTARAVVGLFKTPICWTKVGLVAARLSNHSVLPKLCKRHLQYAREAILELD